LADATVGFAGGGAGGDGDAEGAGVFTVAISAWPAPDAPRTTTSTPLADTDSSRVMSVGW